MHEQWICRSVDPATGEPLTIYHRMALVAAHARADIETGHFFMAQQGWAEMAGMSVSKLKPVISDLCNMGFITRTSKGSGRGGKASEYVLHYSALEEFRRKRSQIQPRHDCKNEETRPQRDGIDAEKGAFLGEIKPRNEETPSPGNRNMVMPRLPTNQSTKQTNPHQQAATDDEVVKELIEKAERVGVSKKFISERLREYSLDSLQVAIDGVGATPDVRNPKGLLITYLREPERAPSPRGAGLPEPPRTHGDSSSWGTRLAKWQKEVGGPKAMRGEDAGQYYERAKAWHGTCQAGGEGHRQN